MQGEQVLVYANPSLDHNLQKTGPAIRCAEALLKALFKVGGKGFIHYRLCVTLCIEDDLSMKRFHIGKVPKEGAPGDAGVVGDGTRRWIKIT